MPMTGAGMGAAIKTAIQAIPDIDITDSAELTSFCNAVGDAVVQYIQANASVSASGADPQGGIVNSTGTVS